MAKPNIKRITIAGVIALAVIGGGIAAAAALNKGRQNPVTPEEPTAASESTAEVTGETTEPVPTETTTEFIPPSYPAVPLNVSPVVPMDMLERIEAEEAQFTGQLVVEDMRAGYSGEGYLAGFSKREGDSVSAVFDVPSPQHYNLIISVCADSPVTNTLLLNGEKVGDFTIEESELFTRVTFPGVYLPEGKATLSIGEEDGYFALDYFEIQNSREMSEFRYEDTYG